MTKKTEKKTPMLKKMVSRMVEQTPYEWPPSCIFVTYQPERPVRAEKK